MPGKTIGLWKKKKRKKNKRGVAKKNKNWTFRVAFGYRPASLDGEKIWACRNWIAPQVAATGGLLCPGLALTVRHQLSSRACKVFTCMILFLLCPLISWSLACCSDAHFDDPGPHSRSFHPLNWCLFLLFSVPHLDLSWLWPLSLASTWKSMQPSK